MAMQSILTKFIAPTNTRGARIKAVQSGWSEKRDCKTITISYPYEFNTDKAHAIAAQLLADKLGWNGRFIQASLGAWSDFAYCFAMDDGSGFGATTEGK